MRDQMRIFLKEIFLSVHRMSVHAPIPRNPVSLYFYFSRDRANISWTQFSFANVFNMADGKEGSLKKSKHSSCF